MYPEEPCFCGDEESFWCCITNIGKFLETSLKKLREWNFVKEGGMETLVQISYDPMMHHISSIKTKIIKKEEKEQKEEQDITHEISAKFGSSVIPQTNPKMTTAQKAIANSYPHIQDTEWPNLINLLLETCLIV
eukprot:349477_1